MLNKVLLWKSIIYSLLLILAGYLNLIGQSQLSAFAFAVPIILIYPFNRFSKLNTFEKAIIVGSTLIYVVSIVKSIFIV